MKKTYEALAIANEFLDAAKKSENKITHMKLQKLIYIAHGYYLAIQDFPLIHERVRAWKYGPVIISVYEEFKIYGHNYITEKGTTVDLKKRFQNIDNNILKADMYTPVVKEKEILKFVDEVWKIYGKYTAIELSNLTHEEGTPWYQAHVNNESVIKDSLIQEYYKKF